MGTVYAIEADRVLWERVDDVVTLLDLEGSAYHELNPTAALLWEAIVDGASREGLVALLVETYDVEDDDARRDVGAFVDTLAAQGLVTVRS